MTRIIKCVEAHYEAHEVPFGCTYEWHPAYTALECDCGEKLVLTGMSTKTARNSTYETMLLIPRTRPGATTTSRRTTPTMNEISDNSQTCGREQAEKAQTQAWEAVELLERARELIAEDSATQPAMKHLEAALHEAKARAAVLENWYQRTYGRANAGGA
jgi:hypothetical protein